MDPIEIKSNVTYKFNQKDQKFLNYYVATVLKLDKQVTFEKSWQFAYDDKDFRKQVLLAMKQFQNKIEDQNKQIQKYKESIEKYQELQKWKSYLEVFQMSEKILKQPSTEKENIAQAFILQKCKVIQQKLRLMSLQLLPYKSFQKERIQLEKKKEKLDFYQNLMDNIHEPALFKNFVKNNQKRVGHLIGDQKILALKQIIIKKQENQKFSKVFKTTSQVLSLVCSALINKQSPLLQAEQKIEQISSSYRVKNEQLPAQSQILSQLNLLIKCLNFPDSQKIKIVNKDQVRQYAQTMVEQMLILFEKILLKKFTKDSLTKHYENLINKIKFYYPNSKKINSIASDIQQIYNQNIQFQEFTLKVENLELNNQYFNKIKQVLKLIDQFKEFYSMRHPYLSKQTLRKHLEKQLTLKLIKQIGKQKTYDQNKSCYASLKKQFKLQVFMDPLIIKGLDQIQNRKESENKTLESCYNKLNLFLSNLSGKRQIKNNVYPNQIQFFKQLSRCIDQIIAVKGPSNSKIFESKIQQLIKENQLIAEVMKDSKRQIFQLNQRLNDKAKQDQTSFHHQNQHKLSQTSYNPQTITQKTIYDYQLTKTQLSQQSNNIKRENQLQDKIQRLLKDRNDLQLTIQKQNNIISQLKINQDKYKKQISQKDQKLKNFQNLLKYNNSPEKIIQLIKQNNGHKQYLNHQLQNQSQLQYQNIKYLLDSKILQTQKMGLGSSKTISNDKLSTQRSANTSRLNGNKSNNYDNMVADKIDHQKMKVQTLETQLQKEKQQLNATISKLASANAKLQSISYQLQKYKTKSKDQLEQKQNQIQALKSKIHTIQNQINGYKRQIQTLSNQKKSTDQKIVQLQKKCESLLKQKQLALKKIKDQDNEKDQLNITYQQEKGNLQRKIQDEINKNKQNQAKIEDLFKKEASLNKELEKSAQKLKSLVQEHQRQKTKIRTQMQNQMNQKILQLKKNIQTQQQVINTTQDKLKQKQEQISKLNNQIIETLNQSNLTLKQKQDKILELTNQLNEQEQKIKAYQAELEEKQAKFLELTNQINQNQTKTKELNQKIAFLQNRITELLAIDPEDRMVQNFQMEIESERTKVNKYANEKDQFKKKLKEKEKQLDDLKVAKTKEVNAQKISYNKLNEQLQKTKKALLKAQQTSQSPDRFASNDRFAVSNQPSAQQKLKIGKLESDLLKQQNEKKAIQQALAKKNTQIAQLSKQYEEKIKTCEKKIFDLKREITVLQSTSESRFQENTSLEKKNSDKKQNISKSNILFDRLFNGQAMVNEYQKKYHLMITIQSETYKKIARTKLLYRFDPQNPTNFHKYIDKIPNLLIIVRNAANIFGAFSTSKMQQQYKQPASTVSFIFSFSKGDEISTYPISYEKNNAKSLTYDEYFLIVGNSEIRLRAGEKSVYSNFGINNGYFQTLNDNVNDLLKANDARECPIETYECFEVIFQEKQAKFA